MVSVNYRPEAGEILCYEGQCYRLEPVRGGLLLLRPVIGSEAAS